MSNLLDNPAWICKIIKSRNSGNFNLRALLRGGERETERDGWPLPHPSIYSIYCTIQCDSWKSLKVLLSSNENGGNSSLNTLTHVKHNKTVWVHYAYSPAVSCHFLQRGAGFRVCTFNPGGDPALRWGGGAQEGAWGWGKMLSYATTTIITTQLKHRKCM